MNNNFTDSATETAALRNQVFTLFLALIVVSGTLTSVVYYQSRQTSKQLAAAEQALDNIKKNEMAINGFIGQLVDYSKRDPNILPVLKKFGLPPAVPVGQPAPAAAPKK
jgi:preprotein translocase subunit YajC